MTRGGKKAAERRRRAVAAAPIAMDGLDPRAMEAIERFVRLLAHCGCEMDAVFEHVRHACAQIPQRWVKKARAAPREIRDATHVLTVWFSDPAYLDASGFPRPLPLRGPGRSLETLVSRIDGRLDAAAVLAYLLKCRALRRRRSQYVPRSRALSLRGMRGPNEFRYLRALLALLRTFEHNSRPRRQAPSWFEFSAENPRIPKRAGGKFDEFVGVRAMRFLYDADSELHRLELTRQPGEPTVRLGVGVYRFEEDLFEGDNPGQEKLGKARRKVLTGRKR